MRLKKGARVYVEAVVEGDSLETLPDEERSYYVRISSNNDDKVFVKPDKILVKLTEEK